MSYRDRPVGVTILAIIHIVFATVYGMFWLITLFSYRYANPFSLFFTTPFWIFWQLIIGIGLWQCTVWGWGLIIFDCGLDIVWQLIENINNSLTGGVVLSIAINLLIIFYLNLPKVREACNGQISSVLELITLLGLLKKRKPKTASLELQMKLWNWRNSANRSNRKSDR